MLARVRADEMVRIHERLPAAQAALFMRMPRSDQRHCLDVYHTLVQAGYQEEDLLRAALLHDVGKAAGRTAGRRMTIFHRVAVVLLQGFPPIGPRWLARWVADGRGWKAPFAIHVRHAQVGAEWAAEAGCSPTFVALIRDHHSDGHRRLKPMDDLAVLQWADEQH
jgi:putative nucleotidyltransferase with HDIG domain